MRANDGRQQEPYIGASAWQPKAARSQKYRKPIPGIREQGKAKTEGSMAKRSGKKKNIPVRPVDERLWQSA
ncbi:hypothetical protein L7F22_031440, partial [Adiantum nelumboides]|nr:hypothetical protein [Adiantum nelumboides]